jgi:hypothetical protein
MTRPVGASWLLLTAVLVINATKQTNDGRQLVITWNCAHADDMVGRSRSRRWRATNVAEAEHLPRGIRTDKIITFMFFFPRACIGTFFIKQE